jgi:ELWxxDGT repeat protein
LWRSDGTGAGTQLLASPSSGLGGPVVPSGTLVFFPAVDAATGFEVWVSDGTAAGTHITCDIVPGNGGSNPIFPSLPFGQYYNLYNLTLFEAFNPGGASWRSDGTAAGTLVLSSNLALGSPPPVELGNAIFFTASDATHGTELWKTDGTAAGTLLVADINPGAGSTSPSSLVALGNSVYFAADNGTLGTELWRTDGTTTQIVQDINPGAGGSGLANLVVVNNEPFFTANDGSTGTELWKSDGTTLGTSLVKDINPGAGSSNPVDLQAANDLV